MARMCSAEHVCSLLAGSQKRADVSYCFVRMCVCSCVCLQCVDHYHTLCVLPAARH